MHEIVFSKVLTKLDVLGAQLLKECTDENTKLHGAATTNDVCVVVHGYLEHGVVHPNMRILCKSLFERCSYNPKLCVVFQGFWFKDAATTPNSVLRSKAFGFSPQRVFPSVLASRNKTTLFSGDFDPCGPQTTVFSRDVDPRNQNCCIFQGFCSSWNQQMQRLRQPSLSNHARETRLQDQGAHACVIFDFSSNLPNKSA